MKFIINRKKVKLGLKQKNASVIILIILISIFSAFSVGAARKPTPAEIKAVQKETIFVFQDFLRLWQEERYFELYKYGKKQSTDQITIEEFATRMVELNWVPVGLAQGEKPAILYRYRTFLYINATILFRHKSNSDIQFRNKQSFLLLKEKGKWRFDLLQMIRSPFYSPPKL